MAFKVTNDRAGTNVKWFDTAPAGWKFQDQYKELKKAEDLPSAIKAMKEIQKYLEPKKDQPKASKEESKNYSNITKLLDKTIKAQGKIAQKEKKADEKQAVKMQKQQNNLQAQAKRTEAKDKEKVANGNGQDEKVAVLGGKKPKEEIEEVKYSLDVLRNAQTYPKELQNADAGLSSAMKIFRNPKSGKFTPQGNGLISQLARYTEMEPQQIEKLLITISDAWPRLAKQIQGAKDGQADCLLMPPREILDDKNTLEFLSIVPKIIWFLQNLDLGEFVQAEAADLTRGLFDANYQPKEGLETDFVKTFKPIIDRLYTAAWEDMFKDPIETARNPVYAEGLRNLTALKLLLKPLVVANSLPEAGMKTAVKKIIKTRIKSIEKVGLVQRCFARTKFKGHAVIQIDEAILTLEKWLLFAAIKKHRLSNYVPVAIEFLKLFKLNLHCLKELLIPYKWKDHVEPRDKVILKTEEKLSSDWKSLIKEFRAEKEAIKKLKTKPAKFEEAKIKFKESKIKKIADFQIQESALLALKAERDAIIKALPKGQSSEHANTVREKYQDDYYASLRKVIEGLITACKNGFIEVANVPQETEIFNTVFNFIREFRLNPDSSDIIGQLYNYAVPGLVNALLPNGQNEQAESSQAPSQSSNTSTTTTTTTTTTVRSSWVRGDKN